VIDALREPPVRRPDPPVGPYVVAGLARAGIAATRALLRHTGPDELRVVLSTLTTANARQQRVMGRVAGSLADHLILTTERWRRGLPNSPSESLVDGAREASRGTCDVVPDRRAAIERAITGAHDEDIVLILGRGDVDRVLFDAMDQPRPFDDRAEARTVLRAVSRTAGCT
jgi:UDP-N-acetylmuramoyl-L-alanyl-D-glutamate--2,6-diaminopimelate ligase